MGMRSEQVSPEMPTYSMPAGGSICTHEDGCISEQRLRLL